MGDCDCGGCDFGSCDCDCDCGNCDCGDCSCDCGGGDNGNCCEGCYCCGEGDYCQCGEYQYCSCKPGADYVGCPSWFCPCCHHSDHITVYCCYSCGTATSDMFEAITEVPVTTTTSTSLQQWNYSNGVQDRRDERKREVDEDGLESEEVPLNVVTDQPLAEGQRQTLGEPVTTQPVSSSNALST